MSSELKAPDLFVLDRLKHEPEADKERARAFLQELAELSQKHGLWIFGCGCCQSPWASGENKCTHYSADFERGGNLANINGVE